MQASELRIGNWVYFLSKKNEHKISRLDFQVWKIDKFNYFTPIPITEEWLLRFGFKVSEEDKSWAYPNWEIIYKLKTNKVGFDPNRKIFGWYFNSMDDYYSWFKIIQYVHQLQNLYFALTGEELELNH